MKKNILLPLLTASLLLISACTGKGGQGGGDNPGGGGGDTPVTPVDDDAITVKFYLDYNQVSIDNVYATYQVKNNSLLEEPTRPTSSDAPLPEYPVFKGWSEKQIIDSDNDLWNFATDQVNLPSGYKTLRLYGFWATV